MRMEPIDATIQILRDIRAELRTTNERLAGVETELRSHGEVLRGQGQALGHLVQRADATNETLGIMNERLGFFERAATVASEARSRLEDRFDDLARRVEALENRDH
jgi:chromosome segregation ATPase